MKVITSFGRRNKFRRARLSPNILVGSSRALQFD